MRHDWMGRRCRRRGELSTKIDLICRHISTLSVINEMPNEGKKDIALSFALTMLSLALHAAIASFFTILNVCGFIFEKVEQSLQRKVNIDFSKQAVVITGCDSGFGELSSRRLAGMGFKVISGCISSAGSERLKDMVAVSMVCDVTKEEDVIALREKTESFLAENHCSLWGVVNNAGIGNSGAVDWISMETFRKVMEVNFFGVLRVTRAMLPLLKKNKHSRIVNLSSVAGLASAPMMASYNASKHAVEGYAKALRAEMKQWNIHVSNINPGFMRTPIVTGGPELTAKEFANVSEELRSQYTDDLYEPSRHVQSILENPQLVVDAIVSALTDVRPPMWYFPGIQAGFIFRHMSNMTGPVMDAIIAVVPSINPPPKPEVVESMQRGSAIARFRLVKSRVDILRQ